MECPIQTALRYMLTTQKGALVLYQIHFFLIERVQSARPSDVLLQYDKREYLALTIQQQERRKQGLGAYEGSISIASKCRDFCENENIVEPAVVEKKKTKSTPRIIYEIIRSKQHCIVLP